MDYLWYSLYFIFFLFYLVRKRIFTHGAQVNEVFKTILNNGNGEVDTFTAVTTLIFLVAMIISGYFLFRVIIEKYKNKNT